jgi:N-methylhydantoinase B
VVNPGTARERVLAPLSDGNVLVKGDVLLLETGGGGGHGHPHDRAAERVLDDVLDGFVSVAAAREEYGVVVVGAELDAEATARLRRMRPAAGAFHRRAYSDVL